MAEKQKQLLRESIAILFRDATLRHAGSVLPLIFIAHIIGSVSDYPTVLFYLYLLLATSLCILFLELANHLREEIANVWLITFPDPEEDIKTFSDEFLHSISLEDDSRLKTPSTDISPEFPSRNLGRALSALFYSVFYYLLGLLIVGLLINLGMLSRIVGTVSSLEFHSDNLLWIIPKEVIAGPISEIITQSFRTIGMRDTIILLIIYGLPAVYSVIFIRNSVRASEELHRLFIQFVDLRIGRQWIGVFILWILYGILFTLL